MTSRKKGSIGFDPLAWMKGGDDGRQTTPAPVSTPAPAPAAQAASPSPAPRSVDRQPAAENTASTVRLGDTLTIEQVGTLYDDLSGRMEAKHLVLDAGSLTRVDTAGLQLLTAFIRAAEGRGARVEWRAPQAALRESARRLGLEGALHLS